MSRCAAQAFIRPASPCTHAPSMQVWQLAARPTTGVQAGVYRRRGECIRGERERERERERDRERDRRIGGADVQRGEEEDKHAVTYLDAICPIFLSTDAVVAMRVTTHGMGGSGKEHAIYPSICMVSFLLQLAYPQPGMQPRTRTRHKTARAARSNAACGVGSSDWPSQPAASPRGEISQLFDKKAA
ncbi:hypothetical protein LZ30DRAFT_402714 [Colletotrichum cereale]|nr:hypothetical protein LZ30DRAFT_402714 [Colletotrichum cereale]